MNDDDNNNKYIKIEINEKTREIELNEIDLNDIKIEINEKTREIELNDINIEIKETTNTVKNIITPIREIILKCLEYSNDAYGVNPNTKLIHKQFANSIFSRVDLYYERTDNNNLYIAIRGTVTLYDVMNDINFIQEKMDEIKIEKDVYVHKGFYQDFKDIKAYLCEFIFEQILSGVTNIYFTGHSRGSSVSTLSSIYIKNLYPSINVYNIGFGCPRLGCEKFTDYYNILLRDTTYLFREDFDIVTRLPIYKYGDLMNQYVIKNNKVVSKYNPNEDDGVIDIIESSLKYHRLEIYKKCDYNFTDIHR
jgi:predicted lipase